MTGKSQEFINRKEGSTRCYYWIAPKDYRPVDTNWFDIYAYDNSPGSYPTQKSELLLERVIDSYSKPGDLVMDAFAGSGTTLAVAEKLKRHWIGIDSGKLAIYTIQKRMFNLKEKIGNKGRKLTPTSFTLYNSGLYDFSQLKKLPLEDWRFFAITLFQCKDEPHKIGGIRLDGFRNGSDVLVFNHMLHGGVVLDYGYIDNLHVQIGSKLGSQFFIIAPAASVTFLEDYVDKGNTRYYILRIPYSIINELHSREFNVTSQPLGENEINEIKETLGFDFIQQPKVKCNFLIRKDTKKLGIVQIIEFMSRSLIKGNSQKQNLETLSMVLVDYDYPYQESQESPKEFQYDKVFYAKDLISTNWEMKLDFKVLGEFFMLTYIDVYGNEYIEIKSRKDFTSEGVKELV